MPCCVGVKGFHLICWTLTTNEVKHSQCKVMQILNGASWSVRETVDLGRGGVIFLVWYNYLLLCEDSCGLDSMAVGCMPAWPPHSGAGCLTTVLTMASHKWSNHFRTSMMQPCLYILLQYNRHALGFFTLPPSDHSIARDLLELVIFGCTHVGY